MIFDSCAIEGLKPWVLWKMQGAPMMSLVTLGTMGCSYIAHQATNAASVTSTPGDPTHTYMQTKHQCILNKSLKKKKKKYNCQVPGPVTDGD